MAHDPVLLAETRAWFSRTAEDLATATYELQANPPFAADASFHAQQAVEKALKGFLTFHSQPFRKTHNLTELGEACVGLDSALRPLLKTASQLTDYAWKFRYPGEPERPSRGEAEEALATARQVYETVLSRLPEEARP